jgi:hypothetical protein
MEIFARLYRKVLTFAKRLAPAGGPAHYRPERHYMRGPRPKTEADTPAGDDRASKAT